MIKRLLSTCLAQRKNTAHHDPRRLLLQWHVTERCNLRCSHCYQDSYSARELSFPEQTGVIGQFEELLHVIGEETGGNRVRGHITVSGGEPFVRDDFLDLLETFHEKKRLFSFAILTNGTFIDDQMARRLKKLNPGFIQVSLEGTRTTHDRIRGNGNHRRTLTSIKNLVRHGVRTFVSFTAFRSNFREFGEVAESTRRLGVSRVWADRLIPRGSASGMASEILTPEETMEFFTIMARASSRGRIRGIAGSPVTMKRALQFLTAGGEPYHCTAGDSLLTLQPNGDVYPCRRMPIRVGNLKETPLADIYRRSDLLRSLRNRDGVSKGCQGCFYAGLCRGGLKCLSYAVTGDPFTRDPGCWLESTRFSDRRSM
jgi:radical SAM protein with 4Fe4S-binding SPASM domain